MEKNFDSQQNGAKTELFEFNLLQLANYLISHRLWIISGTTLCVISALVWILMFKSPVYQATVLVNIDMAQEASGANFSMMPFFMQEQIASNKVSLVEQYFDSKEFKMFLMETLEGELPKDLQIDADVVLDNLAKQKFEVEHPEAKADWVYGHLSIRGNIEKFRIDVSANARKPAVAAAIANIGAHALTEFNRRMLVQRLKSLKGFLEKQTNRTRGELNALEDTLVELQKDKKVISPDEIRAKVNSLQVEQEVKLIEFNRMYASLNAQITEMEGELTHFKQLLQQGGSSHLYIEQIQRRLESLRFQKEISSSGRQVAGSTEAEEIDAGIQKVIGELSSQLKALGPVSASPWDYIKKIEVSLFELKQRRNQAKSELDAQRSAIYKTNNEFRGLPDTLKQISEIKRNIDLTMGLFTQLMTRLQETQIKEAAHANDLIMVSRTDPPGIPSGLGRTKTLVLSVFIGFLLSVLPLFLRFVLLPTIRDVHDLEHLGVPIVGEIGWNSPQTSRLLKFNLAMKNRPIRVLHEIPNGPEANALRYVRFKIQKTLKLKERGPEEKGLVLQVSSVNPKEGRSFITANLADMFAASGVKTCILNLDFDKQGHEDVFPNSVSDPLPVIKNFPREFMFALKRVHPNLFMITSKPIKANMSDHLESADFKAGIDALKLIFDLIIIDSPPILGHVDPLITAQYSDALLMVINQRRTLRTEVESTIRLVQSSLSIPTMGVMNFAFDDISRARRKIKDPDLFEFEKRGPKGGGPKGGGPSGGDGPKVPPPLPSESQASTSGDKFHTPDQRRDRRTRIV